MAKNVLKRENACIVYDNLKKLKKDIENLGWTREQVAVKLTNMLGINVSAAHLITLGKAAKIAWQKKPRGSGKRVFDKITKFDNNDFRTIIEVIDNMKRDMGFGLDGDGGDLLIKWSELANRVRRPNTTT